MPSKISFGLAKKLRGGGGRSTRSAKEDCGVVLLDNDEEHVRSSDVGGHRRRQQQQQQPSPASAPQPLRQLPHQRNVKNGKLVPDSSSSGTRTKSSTATTSSLTTERLASASASTSMSRAAAAAEAATTSAKQNNSSPPKAATTATAVGKQGVDSNTFTIFSNDDDDGAQQFFFPSFADNGDNDIIWADEDDAQQQQSDQTCTTYSNSISVSHQDDDAGEANHDGPSLTRGEDPGLVTEEADPPAILIDLDEDEALFDTKLLEHGKKDTGGEGEEKIGEAKKKTTNMFFVMQDNDEYNSHLVGTKVDNEFWLSSSSSSSFFGLSGSQTQSDDNDDNENDTCWNTDDSTWQLQSQMNNHRRVVSPSPSPDDKIHTTTLTTTSSTTMDTTSSASISSPTQLLQSNLREEDDLAAWGEIISAIKKSPIRSMMSDSPTKNVADFNDEDFVFGDSFFNNGFDNISSIITDIEGEEPENNNNKDDENGSAIKSAIENSSVGSDDAVFLSVDDIASWSNSANITSHDEKNEDIAILEREGETNINHRTASTSWENDAESTSQLDALFNYSLSNEDPIAVNEGNEKHCESVGGNGNELPATAVVAAFAGVAAGLPTIKTVGDQDIMNGHDDSVRYTMHAQAQHQKSQEPNQQQIHQPLHSHQLRQQLQHRHHRRRMHPSSPKDQHDKLVDISTLSDDADIQFLLANLEATIGPRGVAPDMESLSGRSSIRSARSARSDHGQEQQHHHPADRSSASSSRRGGQQHSPSGGASVCSRASRSSRASRKSYRSHQSTRSALTSMSKETRSVANDLFRLEAQLAEQVARQQSSEEEVNGGVLLKSNSAGSSGGGGRGVGVIQLDSSEEVTSSADEHDTPTRPLGAAPVPRPKTDFELIAPPGKLGILLSNVKMSTQQNGGGNSMNNKTINNTTGPTHVSSVRSTSVLAGRVHVGDIFLSIDGEDVTRMNSLEITNLMARKSEYSRVLRLQPLVNSTVAQWQEWI